MNDDDDGDVKELTFTGKVRNNRLWNKVLELQNNCSAGHAEVPKETEDVVPCTRQNLE